MPKLCISNISFLKPEQCSVATHGSFANFWMRSQKEAKRFHWNFIEWLTWRPSVRWSLSGVFVILICFEFKSMIWKFSTSCQRIVKSFWIRTSDHFVLADWGSQWKSSRGQRLSKSLSRKHSQKNVVVQMLSRMLNIHTEKFSLQSNQSYIGNLKRT